MQALSRGEAVFRVKVKAREKQQYEMNIQIPRSVSARLRPGVSVPAIVQDNESNMQAHATKGLGLVAGNVEGLLL